MKVDKAMVEKLADLAKLEFNEQEKDKFVDEFNKIIAFVEKLDKVDTEGVQPLVYVNDHNNVLRNDYIRQEITHDEALENAPVKDSDYFKVPKLMNK